MQQLFATLSVQEATPSDGSAPLLEKRFDDHSDDILAFIQNGIRHG